MTQQVSTDWTAEKTLDLRSPSIAGRLSGKPFLVAIFTREADRNLALAAPDLLAVCKAYRAACDAQGIKLGSINGDADAAIAKAAGE